MSKFRKGTVVRVTQSQFTGSPRGTLGVYLYSNATSGDPGITYHVIRTFDGEERIVYRNDSLEEVVIEEDRTQ